MESSFKFTIPLVQVGDVEGSTTLAVFWRNMTTLLQRESEELGITFIYQFFNRYVYLSGLSCNSGDLSGTSAGDLRRCKGARDWYKEDKFNIPNTTHLD